MAELQVSFKNIEKIEGVSSTGKVFCYRYDWDAEARLGKSTPKTWFCNSGKSRIVQDTAFWAPGFAAALALLATMSESGITFHP